MSTAAAPTPVTQPAKPKSYTTPKQLATAAIVLLALGFVGKYVFRYYLNYNKLAFNDPVAGAANYWAMRGWLLMHMTGGMIALLAGPWQFWTGFRSRYARLHRWTGRIFLLGVGVGSIGAIRMGIATTFGWAFGVGLLALDFAWVTTTGMAWYAIVKGQVAVHKTWMVRAYIVTFGFVTFRLLNDYPPLSRVQPGSDRANLLIWACWALPLLIGEIVMQLRRMRIAV
jgi:uncharacterized membrane protein YozB (DUF420 family)